MSVSIPLIARATKNTSRASILFLFITLCLFGFDSPSFHTFKPEVRARRFNVLIMTSSQLVDPAPAVPKSGGDEPQPSSKRPLRFWGTFVALCVISFLCVLDVVIITTALPTIIASVGGVTEYVWIANSFIVASAVLQPLFSQIADVFGRRIPFIASTVLFIAGSGVAGGS